ncbi:GNAT family N-acetyltransferase [Tepidiforma sp.]|uniref:GNAT family N-acetyltransferase n=1 Tax=Tepidiforma sp. TaxID=2682230 RepID=UPI002ADE21CE|nr:GNAT family N-acetyltransferase [Tepidiforma sp.]
MRKSHPLAPAIAAAMRDATVRLGSHPTLGEVTELAGFTCIDAGLGVSAANVALPGPGAASGIAALRELATWFSARGINFRIDIPSHAPSALMAAAMTLGLHFKERQLVMLLERPLPVSSPRKLDVRIAATLADVSDFCAIDAHEFGGEPLVASIVEAASEDPRVLLFVGTLQGRPVARIAAMLHGELATLHSLYVHPSVRGQGLGTEMTTAAIEAVLAPPNRPVALLSTLVAQPLYRRLGFVPIGEVVVLGVDLPLS